eukprot:335655_1
MAVLTGLVCFAIIAMPLISVSVHQRIDPNYANCNDLYAPNVTYETGKRMGTLFVTDYFEMELDVHLHSCMSSGDNQWIVWIGGTDNYMGTNTSKYDSFDRLPILVFWRCADVRYRWSDNSNKNNNPGSLPITITYPGTYHIYILLTPNSTTLAIDSVEFTFTATSRSNYSGTEWNIWAGPWPSSVEAPDGYMTDICIRSWTAGSYTPQPTTDPTKNPTKEPSNVPTTGSANPTNNPSVIPSIDPTGNPSANPSDNPSVIPSIDPTGNPSANPSDNPTTVLTTDSANPTNNPSANPTSAPSVLRPTIIAYNGPSATGNPSTPTASIISTNYTISITMWSTENRNDLDDTSLIFSNQMVFIAVIIICLLCCAVAISCCCFIQTIMKHRREKPGLGLSTMHAAKSTDRDGNVADNTDCVQSTNDGCGQLQTAPSARTRSITSMQSNLSSANSALSPVRSRTHTVPMNTTDAPAPMIIRVNSAPVVDTNGSGYGSQYNEDDQSCSESHDSMYDSDNGTDDGETHGATRGATRGGTRGGTRQ